MRKRIINKELIKAVSQERCSVCYKPGPSDPAHIKTRGSGGHDRPFNLVALCHTHHVEQHAIGIMSFILKYPNFRAKLRMMGWTFDGGRLWNEKINPHLDKDR